MEPIAIIDILRKIVRELETQPSVMLFDGSWYKVIPTELADELVKEWRKKKE